MRADHVKLTWDVRVGDYRTARAFTVAPADCGAVIRDLAFGIRIAEGGDNAGEHDARRGCNRNALGGERRIWSTVDRDRRVDSRRAAVAIDDGDRGDEGARLPVGVGG